MSCLTDNAVGPRAAGVDDPVGFDALLFSAQTVAHQHCAGPAMADVHCQNLCVVAGGCPGFDRFYQPFGDQAFRKFTLCVFETENRPAASGIE